MSSGTVDAEAGSDQCTEADAPLHALHYRGAVYAYSG